MTQTLTPEQASGPLMLCRVTNVNYEQYTVDVVTEFSHKDIQDVPIGALFSNDNHGGGVVVMPEVGSFCNVIEASDGTKMVWGFVVSPQTRQKVGEDGVPLTDDVLPDFSGYRPPMEPGDVSLSTRDGNHIALRRGGIISVAASDLCQRMYISTANMIHDYFMRYAAKSPLGEIVWDHGVLLDNSDNQTTGVLIQGSWRENVEDTEFAVEVRVGKLDREHLDTDSDSEHLFAHEKKSQPIASLSEVAALSITIHSRGDGPSVTYALQVSREGDMFMLVGGHAHVDIEKTLCVNVAEQAMLRFGQSYLKAVAESGSLQALVGQLVLTSLAAVQIQGSTISLASGGASLTIGESSSSVQGTLSVGTGAKPVVTDRGNLLTLLKDHKHLVEVPGVGRFITNSSDTLTGIEDSASSALKAK
jgi:hypothetical protein